MIIGGLYASPNLYGEDPAIQVSGLRGAEVNALILDSVVEKLDEEKIGYKKTELENGRILIRLNLSLIHI